MQASSESQKASSEAWANDLLDREAEGRFLIDFLTRRIAERAAEGRSRSYVLNLDAPWGEGKTYFLRCLRKQLEAEGYLVSHVNAWRDDHADTPLVAVMSAIEETLRPHFNNKKALSKTWKAITDAGGQLAVSAAKGVAQQAIKKFLGSEIIDEFKTVLEETGIDQKELNDAAEKVVGKLTDTAGDILLKSFRDRSESIETFKLNLEEILNKITGNQQASLPLFILVDELDRCRPTYAILMLEQIKHLFEANNVVFIIATDSGQLAHAIRAVYGSSFESEQYLKRFFDRKYVFEKQSMSRYVQYLFEIHAIDTKKLAVPHQSETAPAYFLKHMEAAKLSLRDADQCMDLLRNVATVWDMPLPLQLIYLLPLIIAHHTGRSSWFTALTSGPHTPESVGGSTFNWKYTLPSYGRMDERQNDNLLTTLLRFSNSFLWETVHNEDKGADIVYARDILREEFNVLAELNQTLNLQRNMRQVKSTLLMYPSLVRSAGRLSQK